MLDEGNYSYYCLMDLSTLEELIEDNEDFIGGSGAGKYNQVLVKCNELSDVKAVKTAIENMGYGTYSAQDAVEMGRGADRAHPVPARRHRRRVAAGGGHRHHQHDDDEHLRAHQGDRHHQGARLPHEQHRGHVPGRIGVHRPLRRGALGLGVSFGLGLLLNAALASSGLTSVIPLYLAVGAVAFSVLVGLLAGLYPAIRAMR